MKLKFSNQKPNPEIDRLLVGYKNNAEKLTVCYCIVSTFKYIPLH